MKKIIIFIYLLISQSMFSQEARLDTNKIQIGEQTVLHIECTTNDVSGINWPFFNDTIVTDIEIIRAFQIDTLILNKSNVLIYIIIHYQIDINNFHIHYLSFYF